MKPNKQKPVYDVISQSKQALHRCQSEIDFYKGLAAKARTGLYLSRLLAVLLSGFVPVLVIIQMSFQDKSTRWLVVSILIALFPACATIIATLDDVFLFKEHWVRFSEASESLKSEIFKYETRTTAEYGRDMDDYQALSNFVSAVEKIRVHEIRSWSVQTRKMKATDDLLNKNQGEG